MFPRPPVAFFLTSAPAGELAHRLVRRQLQRIFAYRHEAMLRLFSPGTKQPFIIDFDRDSHEAASPPLAEHAPAVPRRPSPLE